MVGKRAKVEPGQMSAALSAYMDWLLPKGSGLRKDVAARALMSESKLSRLINGLQSWYLEDVEQVCIAADLDPRTLIVALAQGKDLQRAIGRPRSLRLLEAVPAAAKTRKRPVGRPEQDHA